MPVESCISSLFPFTSQQSNGLHIHRGLEPMHFLLNGDGPGVISGGIHGIQIKQEPEDTSDSSGGEEKDFGEKWEQLSDEKSQKAFPTHLDDPHHNFNQNGPTHNNNNTYPAGNNSILLHHQNSQQSYHQHPQPHHVPDEASLDSQDNPEGSNTASASTGSTSSPCTESTKETTSFLFVGPLGKKRKYSRQRATSDDNEPESHPPTTPEEMDQSQSPSSPGENSQSDQGYKGSSAQEHSPPLAGSEPISTIGSTPPRQQSSASPDSGGESTSENSNMAGGTGTEGATVIISKPSPIIGAPTSVIRRVNRKKQEHPLPLNLSVSSPPSNSNSYSSSSNSSSHAFAGPPTPGRLAAPMRGAENCSTTTNPSVIRDELYFEGRPTAGDRQVFVWRYRDDVTAPTTISSAVAGPLSPSSTISATSFAVPDVMGSKLGSSASSSASSSRSQPQYATGSQDPNTADSRNSGSNASGKPPKKKLKCGDCGKEFSQLRNYRYHRSRHEGSDQFSCTCPVCGKQFNDRGYLSSHMKIHRNAKEYRCEFCTKGFNQRVAYNMHRRIHTGHRPHQCEVCGKSFSRRMLLKQHMRIHTGERPYSCGVCNKAFADRSNMLLHQRLHSGERPYVCEICKKSFSKNHHLKTHMNHHAGIKPYECPKCHARFSQSSNMKTHLKKCSGVINPTTNQRQQMLRRNPVDIGRTTAQIPNLPSLPGVVAAAAAAAAAASGRGGEPLPPLSAASRLIYEQQSLSLLSQSISNGTISGVMGGPNSGPPQLSPGHSRGQVPIESLLLHLNVSRSRHPSQGSSHSGAPLSPTSAMSFPDLQMMLRNAAVAAAASSSTGSRASSNSVNHGHRAYSSPSSPGSSSNPHLPSGMNAIPGMQSFAPSHTNAIRRSPVQGSMSTNTNDPLSASPLSPMMTINSNMGLLSYGGNNGSGRIHHHSGGPHSHIDSSAMPPPFTNGSSSMRNIPASNSLIPAELMSPSPNMLRIDTRGMEGYQGMVSPSDKSGRQGRVVPNPMMSPRRKQLSPSSLSSTGSFIPLSTLESAAIASGLRSPSQVVRLLSSALREPDNSLSQNNQSYTRLPSISHQNVLEAMVAAAAAEQNSTRIRQVPSPPPHHTHHHHHQQQMQSSPPSQAFQFPGDGSNLSTLHINHVTEGGASLGPGPHHSSHSQSQHGGPTNSHFSVITSSHIIQQEQQSLPVQQSGSVRYSPSTSASRLTGAPIDHPSHHHHTSTNQQIQVELHHQQQPPPPPAQQRQHGYHQSLLHNHVSQTSISQSSSSGYSSGSPSSGNGNSNSSYSAFSHSIIRSRSHSPNTIDHIRDRNQDYQN